MRRGLPAFLLAFPLSLIGGPLSSEVVTPPAPPALTAATIGAACGATTQLLFNRAGSCTGSSGLTIDASGSVLIAGAAQGGASDPPLTITQTWNNVNTGFTGLLVQITGTAYNAGTSLLLDIQRSGFHILTVDQSNVNIPNGSLTAANATLSGYLQFGPGAYGATSALPTCNAGQDGVWHVVTDALSPTYLGTLVGGGLVRIPVYCDATSWKTH